MDILRKSLLIVAWMVTGFSSTLISQEYDVIVEAFKSSYEHENSGDFTEAAKDILDVYAHDSYEMNLRLGWLNYEVGKFSESEKYYQVAVNLMPYSIEARLGLIFPKSVMGKWNEVIQIYKNILDNFPDDPYINYKLGLVYYERQQFDLALDCFRKVVELWPFDYDGLLMYAHTHAKLGKIREARVLYYKVLMASPEDTDALNGLNTIKDL